MPMQDIFGHSIFYQWIFSGFSQFLLDFFKIFWNWKAAERVISFQKSDSEKGTLLKN